MGRYLSSIIAGLLLWTVAPAQQSMSYKLQEFVSNNGGDPLAGNFASSSSYRIKLDSIGEAIIGTGIASPSFRIESGFTASHPPPAEVMDLRFSNKTILVWSPEGSAGSYNVYENLVSTLPGTFGNCLESGLTSPTATVAAQPSSGGTFFYLVTVRNGLAEEGTKGFRSNGAERSNTAPCP